jgi:protease-4
MDAIDFAKTDPNIIGIYLEPSWLRAGFSQAEELRHALNDFKSSGKFVVAYADRMSEGSYYVCSVADSIFIHPEGNIEYNGIAYTSTFFKGAMDKLGIEAQVFKVGDYKSAIEPFVRKDMSAENREQVSSFINGIYDNLASAIATSRNLAVEQVKEMSGTMAVRHVRDAERFGLVDGLKYSDEMDQMLTSLSGQANDAELVSLKSYRRSYTRSVRSKNRIAVIVASGEIINGEAESSYIGADSFVEEIRRARESSSIKSIVIRINSPGGDFLASDKLWREVKLAKEQKPVIISMSTYAASGGYYMAMAADTIVSNANTITGSIGIYGIIFNISPFMEGKLGITSDVVRTGEFSDILTTTRRSKTDWWMC